MANSLLKTLTVSLGAGLGVTFGRALVSSGRRPGPAITPVLDRLEEIETRVKRVETSPHLVTPEPDEMEALGTIVSSQNETLSGLRDLMERVDRRNSERAEAFVEKMASVQEQVPVQIETAIAARIADLEHRLRGEFQAIHRQTVDSFVHTVEQRVVGRIAAIESSLTGHARSIQSLREKSLKTDENVHQLLQTVDRLCVRAEIQAKSQLRTMEEKAGQTDTQSRFPQPDAARSEAHGSERDPSRLPTEAEETFAAYYRGALARSEKMNRRNVH